MNGRINVCNESFLEGNTYTFSHTRERDVISPRVYRSRTTKATCAAESIKYIPLVSTPTLHTLCCFHSMKHSSGIVKHTHMQREITCLTCPALPRRHHSTRAFIIQVRPLFYLPI